MADEDLVAILRQGARAWNDWRRANKVAAAYPGRFHADLVGADLRDARLAGADLSDVDLRGADLRGADLTRADLRGAHLSRPKDISTRPVGPAFMPTSVALRELARDPADLANTNLRDTDLRGADLRGTRNLTQRQLDLAFGDEHTLRPEGLSHPIHWTIVAESDDPAPDTDAESDRQRRRSAPPRRAVVVDLAESDPDGSRAFVLALRDYVATARTEADRLDNVAPDEAREIRDYLDRLDAALADLLGIIDRLKRDKAGLEANLERARARIAALEQDTAWRTFRQGFAKKAGETLGVGAAGALIAAIGTGVTLLASEAAPEGLELAKRVMGALIPPK